MPKYTNEFIKILSLTLSLALFPHLVLAEPGKSASKSSKFAKILEAKIQTMTVDEKVGQLFMVGFPQKKITPELLSFISQYKPGSFLLFKRNISSVEQIRQLNTDLYKLSYKTSRLPPLIAIDQEGGAVSRLPISPAPPNALALGQTQSPLLAEEMGHQTGLFLREVGFNMNLAPVLDVADATMGSFIGVRSFGSNPNTVAELGTAYSKGLLKARVIPTAKHFPGTGNLKADPHYNVAENKSSLASLQKSDLVPYKKYSALGRNVAVMLSHYIYPALDPSREPASFSKKITNELLRGELEYKGLVITDDLQMKGSRQLLRPEVAALRALQAGAEIVMLTYSFADQGKAFTLVKKAVENGELPLSLLDEKVRRILTVKAFANLYRRSANQPSLSQGLTLTSKDYSSVESSILEQNLKLNLLAKARSAKTPFLARSPSSSEKVCVLAPTRLFISSFRKFVKRPVDTKLLIGDFDRKAILSWIDASHCSAVILTITGPKTAALTKSLPRPLKLKTVAVNLGAPKFFQGNEGYLRVLQLYFNHRDSGKKVALHLDEILNSPGESYVLLD